MDFIEMHVFGCQPKSPNRLVDPVGFRQEIERSRAAYARAYCSWWQMHMSNHDPPCRFTVHVVDVPDAVASYEFYGVGLLQ